MLEISTEARGQEVISATQLKKHGRSQWLPGAGQDDGNMQKSPPHGITERTRRAASCFLKFITLI